MIKQEVQVNEQQNNNNNNKRERKTCGEGYQPLVTPKVTSLELSVLVQYKLHKMEEGSDI